MVALSDCLACPGGKACEFQADSTASASLPQCAAGFYCTSGAATKFPMTEVSGSYGPCPVGYYCEAGTTTPTPCPDGTFSNQQRAISSAYCMTCPPGFLCKTAGNVGGLSQPSAPTAAGIRTVDHILENEVCSSTSTSEYCPKGNYIAQQCYTGYYQDTAS